MIKLFRLLRLTLHLLGGALIVVFYALILRRDAGDERFKSMVQAWYLKACHLVGLNITVHGKPENGPVLMVANHVSWLDIPLMASLCKPRFLSKSEVRRWPIIGWTAEKIDTLFIVRGERTAAEAASSAIVDGLKQDNTILIFPEGKTTMGDNIGFFFPRLFGAAIRTASRVQPVVIHYTDDNSSEDVSELVPYVGEQTLVHNIWQLLGCRNLQARVYFLDAVESEGMPRKELAAHIHNQMQGLLKHSRRDYLLSLSVDAD